MPELNNKILNKDPSLHTADNSNGILGDVGPARGGPRGLRTCLSVADRSHPQAHHSEPRTAGVFLGRSSALESSQDVNRGS